MYKFLETLSWAFLLLWIGSIVVFWYLSEKSTSIKCETYKETCVLITFISVIGMVIATAIRIFLI